MLLLQYPEMKRSASYRRLSDSPFSVKRIDICPWEEGVQGNLETYVYRKPTHTDKYLAFDSHHPICHKKSVGKTLLRRADCLPSSLDSKAEERKYVSNVLKANGYTKTFLRNCQKPVTNSNALDEREPVTGFAVIPYIQGVTEPIKRILNSHNVKVAQKPFQTSVSMHWWIACFELKTYSSTHYAMKRIVLCISTRTLRT